MAAVGHITAAAAAGVTSGRYYQHHQGFVTRLSFYGNTIGHLHQTSCVTSKASNMDSIPAAAGVISRISFKIHPGLITCQSIKHQHDYIHQLEGQSHSVQACFQVNLSWQQQLQTHQVLWPTIFGVCRNIAAWLLSAAAAHIGGHDEYKQPYYIHQLEGRDLVMSCPKHTAQMIRDRMHLSGMTYLFIRYLCQFRASVCYLAVFHILLSWQQQQRRQYFNMVYRSPAADIMLGNANTKFLSFCE